ncbi:MAG: hypothetical protein FWG18_01855 [Alphaproteobacteria bacterium]|nr:hypothetical protein [Alphaproteobacteria bacterium]
MKKLLTTYYLLLTTCILGACTFQTKHRGYIFPEDADAQISTVKTTVDLEEKFGTPMAKTVYGQPVWIYYGADENYHGPFPLTYSDRTVLLVWVSGNNVVKTKILKDKDLPDVRIAAGATPIPAEIQLNVFEELLNNIGRFSPAGLGQ